MGEYEGIFRGVSSGCINFEPDSGMPEYSYPAGAKVLAKVQKLTAGDHVVIEVEFEHYTVTNIWGPTSNRMLLRRIEALEQKLEGKQS